MIRLPPMTRQESDREDLIREATALRRRAEWNVPGEPENVIAGFRADGSPSIYFGPDPVYHFDEAGRLRRAFVEEQLFRTQGDTLARLTRTRTDSATELRRSDLVKNDLNQFLTKMKERLTRFQQSLSQKQFTLVRKIPDDDEIVPDLLIRLEQILCAKQPLAPRFSGKR